jgi:hypothetical protein
MTMTRLILNIFLLLLLFECSNRQDKKTIISDADSELIGNESKSKQIIQEHDKFFKYMDSKFNMIKNDIQSSDTYKVSGYRLILQVVPRDSCLNLMFNSKSHSYFGACRSDLKENLSKYSERINDSCLVIHLNNDVKDTIYSSLGIERSYVRIYIDYIPEYSYHVLSFGSREGCGYKIMKSTGKFFDIPYCSGFSLNPKNGLIFFYNYSVMDGINKFWISKLEKDSITNLISGSLINKTSLWGIEAVFWSNDSTLAMITTRHSSQNNPELSSYTLLKVNNNSN